jgi:hypothetical protein
MSIDEIMLYINPILLFVGWSIGFGTGYFAREWFNKP